MSSSSSFLATKWCGLSRERRKGREGKGRCVLRLLALREDPPGLTWVTVCRAALAVGLFFLSLSLHHAMESCVLAPAGQLLRTGGRGRVLVVVCGGELVGFPPCCRTHTFFPSYVAAAADHLQRDSRKACWRGSHTLCSTPQN